MKCNTLKKIATVTSFISACLFCSVASADSSVWKVSKGDDHVYLGGTIHILPISEFPLPEEFTTAYKNSDAVILETKLPDPADTSFQAKMMEKVAYTNQQKLSTKLSSETFKALENYLAPFGINLKELDGFKPGLIVSMMAMMEAQRSGIAGEGVDAYYNQLAAKESKPLEYLESMDFQLDLLANMGAGDEEALIKSTLEQMDEFNEIFKKLIPAWRAGDEALLAELVIKSMKEDDPSSFKTMMTDRNHNWIPHIEKMFNDNDKEFILVGVGHLVGEESVIDLLKQKGYQIDKL